MIAGKTASVQTRDFPGLSHGRERSQSAAVKRSLTPIFAVLALAAGAFAWLQHDSAARLREQIDSLTAERDAARKAQAEIARMKAAADIAQENVARLTAERDAALARAKNLPAGGAPVPQTGAPQPAGEKAAGGMMESFAKMFSTEEGKKMMRAQMGMQLKMMYGGLAKELKLDPKVADQVMALLGDRQMAMTEASFAAMKNGAMDEAAAKEIAAKTAGLKTEYDGKLKTVLGDDGVTQLNKYERTLGDRMMLNMHEQQFAAAGSPLDAGQRDSLLQIMQAERLKTPPGVFDASNAGDPGKQMAALRDDAAVESWLKQEEDYQRRVLQAATQTLNPDQVNALQESFKQQLEMQKFGMKMSKEMFQAPPSGATGSPPPAAK